MSKLPRYPLKSGTWRYGIIGGIVSIPLSVGLYWLSGMGTNFSTLPIFFGGLLAGYLVQKNSGTPARAGIAAGILGGLPGYIWIFPQVIQTVTAWSSSPGAVVILGISIAAIVAVATLPGLIGGVVGGWLGKKVKKKQIPAVSS